MGEFAREPSREERAARRAMILRTAPQAALPAALSNPSIAHSGRQAQRREPRPDRSAGRRARRRRRESPGAARHRSSV